MQLLKKSLQDPIYLDKCHLVSNLLFLGKVVELGLQIEAWMAMGFGPIPRDFPSLILDIVLVPYSYLVPTCSC